MTITEVAMESGLHSTGLQVASQVEVASLTRFPQGAMSRGITLQLAGFQACLEHRGRCPEIVWAVPVLPMKA